MKNILPILSFNYSATIDAFYTNNKIIIDRALKGTPSNVEQFNK